MNTDLINCVLVHQDHHLVVKFQDGDITRVVVPMLRTQKGKSPLKYYVSFYWDGYRHWAQRVVIGEKFVARRTKDYQYSGRRTGGAQQARIDRVVRSTRNRHAKSLY